MSSCKCSLNIHERRRHTRYPVRVPILTVDEHIFLSAVVDDAIKERQGKIRKLKRSYERTCLRKGLTLLRGVRRELIRS